MSDKNFYVLGDDNCKYEGMSKEQIIATIQEAISTGTIPELDAGVITKIKEQNKQRALSFWVGSQAEYNAIQKKADNCFYIISNSENLAELKRTVEENIENITALGENVSALGENVSALGENVSTLGESVAKINDIQTEVVDLGTGAFREYSKGSNITFRRTGNIVQVTGIITTWDAFSEMSTINGLDVMNIPTIFTPVGSMPIIAIQLGSMYDTFRQRIIIRDGSWVLNVSLYAREGKAFTPPAGVFLPINMTYICDFKFGPKSN